MEKKAKELLRKLRKYVNREGEPIITNAMYISPAQAMRNAADEIERKDALLAEVDAFLLNHNE